MDKQMNRMSIVAFPLGTALGFPVIIAGAAFVLGDGLPPQALAVMLGAYGMGLVWATLAVVDVRATRVAPASAEQEPVAVPADVTGLELIYTIPRIAAPCTVGVMSAFGVCPRGLRVGDTVDIDAEGNLSRPLCRVAADTLTPVVMNISQGRDFGAEVRCVCPLAPRQLTFAPRPVATAGAS